MHSDHTVPLVLRRGEPQALDWTAERILEGGIVAIPTDTVYGLVASIEHPEALRRIYEIKGRPTHMPLPVLVSSADALARIVHIDDSILPLFDAFWPGPLTVVLPAIPGFPKPILGPGSTVGVRLPNHPIAIEIIEKTGGAVASTSANRTGKEPARTAAEVVEALGTDLDLVLDGGRAPGGTASTVVAIDGWRLRFIREGALPITEVIRIWDEIRRDS